MPRVWFRTGRSVAISSLSQTLTFAAGVVAVILMLEGPPRALFGPEPG